MDFSGTNTKAVLIAVIGIASISAIRFVLEFVYDRYERRLRQRDPLAVARRRTTFNFARRLTICILGIVVAWSVLSLYDVTSQLAIFFDDIASARQAIPPVVKWRRRGARRTPDRLHNRVGNSTSGANDTSIIAAPIECRERDGGHHHKHQHIPPALTS